MKHSHVVTETYFDRAIYSNSADNFKGTKNHEDSSDLDENLTESIASPQSFISEIFGRLGEEKLREKLREWGSFPSPVIQTRR